VEDAYVVVHVGDTCHGNKGHVVQDPTQDRVQASVVELVNVLWLQLVVASLPADQVPDEEEANDA
jgi:hypothetical protein